MRKTKVDLRGSVFLRIIKDFISFNSIFLKITIQVKTNFHSHETKLDSYEAKLYSHEAKDKIQKIISKIIQKQFLFNPFLCLKSILTFLKRLRFIFSFPFLCILDKSFAFIPLSPVGREP